MDDINMEMNPWKLLNEFAQPDPPPAKRMKISPALSPSCSGRSSSALSELPFIYLSDEESNIVNADCRPKWDHLLRSTEQSKKKNLRRPLSIPLDESPIEISEESEEEVMPSKWAAARPSVCKRETVSPLAGKLLRQSLSCTSDNLAQITAAMKPSMDKSKCGRTKSRTTLCTQIVAICSSKHRRRIKLSRSIARQIHILSDRPTKIPSPSLSANNATKDTPPVSPPLSIPILSSDPTIVQERSEVVIDECVQTEVSEMESEPIPSEERVPSTPDCQILSGRSSGGTNEQTTAGLIYWPESCEPDPEAAECKSMSNNVESTFPCDFDFGALDNIIDHTVHNGVMAQGGGNQEVVIQSELQEVRTHDANHDLLAPQVCDGAEGSLARHPASTYGEDDKSSDTTPMFPAAKLPVKYGLIQWAVEDASPHDDASRNDADLLHSDDFSRDDEDDTLRNSQPELPSPAVPSESASPTSSRCSTASSKSCEMGCEASETGTCNATLDLEAKAPRMNEDASTSAVEVFEDCLTSEFMSDEQIPIETTLPHIANPEVSCLSVELPVAELNHDGQLSIEEPWCSNEAIKDGKGINSLPTISNENETPDSEAYTKPGLIDWSEPNQTNENSSSCEADFGMCTSIDHESLSDHDDKTVSYEQNALPASQVASQKVVCEDNGLNVFEGASGSENRILSPSSKSIIQEPPSEDSDDSGGSMTSDGMLTPQGEQLSGADSTLTSAEAAAQPNERLLRYFGARKRHLSLSNDDLYVQISDDESPARRCESVSPTRLAVGISSNRVRFQRFDTRPVIANDYYWRPTCGGCMHLLCSPMWWRRV